MPYASSAGQTARPPPPHSSDAGPNDKALKSPRPRAVRPSLARSNILPDYESPTIAKCWRIKTARPSKSPAQERTAGGAASLRAPRRRGYLREAAPSIENVVREFFERPAFRALAGYAGKSSTRRAARSLPARVTKDTHSSWPLQQEHLRCKSRSECHQQAVAFRGHFAPRHPFLQNKQHAGAGKISEPAQHVPRNFGVGACQFQFRFHEGEQLLTAGMQKKCGNVAALQPVARQKIVGQASDLFPDQFRNILGENNVETGIAQVKSHRVQRIGKEKTFRSDDARPTRFAARNHHAGRAVSEQYRGDKVRLGEILALKCERRQFHCHEQRGPIGKRGQVFPGASEARSAGRATEFRDGQA